MPDTPIHIAAYSLTGTTRKAVDDLVRLLDEPVTSEVITPRRPPRMSRFGFMRMGWRCGPWGGGAGGGAGGGGAARAPPAATAAILVVATPVWAGRLPPPVRGWLGRIVGTRPALAVLITHGGSDVSHALTDVEAATGRPVRASVALSDAERKSGKDASKLAWFAAELKRLG